MLKNKNLMLLFLLNLVVGMALRFISQDRTWILVSDVLMISVFAFCLYLNYSLRNHATFGYKNSGFWLIMVVSILGMAYFLWSLLGL